MSLIKVKTKQVLTLPFLNIFALRYVYEKESMTVAEIELMMHSIVSWSKKAIIEEADKKWLEYIGSLLDKEEKGKFEQRKDNFKRLNIDWLKFHNVPKGLYERVIKESRKFIS